jgi:hypothetical protein
MKPGDRISSLHCGSDTRSNGTRLAGLSACYIISTGLSPSLAPNPRAPDLSQCVLKTSWSHLVAGRAVNGLESKFGDSCHAQEPGSDTSPLQPNARFFCENDCGDYFSLFSFGTPGSFPPESGQSSTDLPRQTSSR